MAHKLARLPAPGLKRETTVAKPLLQVIRKRIEARQITKISVGKAGELRADSEHFGDRRLSLLLATELSQRGRFQQEGCDLFRRGVLPDLVERLAVIFLPVGI